MSEHLVFPDARAAADALTFAGRAAKLTEDAVRLQADSGVLVMTAAPLAPKGLGDATPTILALRMLPVDPELECDIVVTATGLAATEDSAALSLPDTGLAPAWAGVSPPRGGWQRTGTVDAATLAARSRAGIAEVAETLPADSGEDIVRMVRARVWGAVDADLAGLPAGASFAAATMGFISGAEEAPLLSAGGWRRLSLTRGHVIVRGPSVTGLTTVRATGAH